MLITVLKSKIHRAPVTGADVSYEGSLTLDPDFMERAGLIVGEKILAGNLRNGERFETYVIEGRRGSGDVILNGATAHLGKTGDLLTIMAFAEIDARQAKNFRARKIVIQPPKKSGPLKR